MLLLFEIARRLVKSKSPTNKQMAFDDLPIGSAIVRLLTLLEFGKYSFNDVFLRGHQFHCFSGTPEERRTAIHNINMAIAAIPKPPLWPMGCSPKMHYLNEPQQVNCSEERLAQGG